jgi:NTE family protein
MSDRSPRSQPSRAQWLRRLASRRKEKVAFVLSGGGPLGALQVGAVKAMFEHGVVPELIVGTSVGALNAAFIAFDPTAKGSIKLESTWSALANDDLFPTSRLKAPWTKFLMRGDRVFENSGIRRIVIDGLGDVMFEDARIPLAVVGAELETGEERVFGSGEVLPALLASTALPGVYPPVLIDGRQYIDGGVANNVPVAPALAMGASTVYVLDTTAVNHRRRDLIRPLDYLMHAFTLARGSRYRVELPYLQASARVIPVPVPRLDFHVPLASLEYSARLIEVSYEAADRFFTERNSVEPPRPLTSLP